MKTVKRQRNQARLVITVDVEFSAESLRQNPPHMRDAADVLRALIAANGITVSDQILDVLDGWGADDIKMEVAK